MGWILGIMSSCHWVFRNKLSLGNLYVVFGRIYWWEPVVMSTCDVCLCLGIFLMEVSNDPYEYSETMLSPGNM